MMSAEQEKETGYAKGSAPARPSTTWTPPDVLRLLAALGQNLGWLILVPLVGLVAAVAYLLTHDPQYDVGAQLMVRFGQELAAPPTVSANSSQQVIPMSKRVEDITVEVQILKDPAIIRAVVDSLGEDFFYGEDEAVTWVQKIKKAIRVAITNTKEAVRNSLVRIGLLPELSRLDRIVLLLQTAISINQVTRSDVIEITLSYPDPALGEIVLRNFLDTYLSKRREVYGDERVSQFLTDELSRIDTELAAAEAEHARMSEDNQIWLIEDQRSLGVANRDALKRELAEARSVIDVSLAQIDHLDAELARLDAFVPSSTSVRRNQVFDDLQLKLIELRLEVEAERNRSGVRSPQVHSLTEQIARLEELIATEPDRVTDSEVQEANPLRAALTAQRTDAELTVTAKRKRVENLEANIAAVEKELRRIDEVGLVLEQQLSRIQRYRLSQVSYQRAVDEARINAEVSNARISNVVVIADPKAGVAPATPRVMRTLLISAIFSVLAASGVILVADALRPKIRNNKDILAFVPEGTLVRAVAEARSA